MMKQRKALLIITLFSALMFSGCSDMGSYSKGDNPWGTKSTGKSTINQVYAPVSMPDPMINMDNNGFAALPPVKVAILLPLSGPQAKVGEALLQSAQLALFDVGYNNFNLIPRDTKGTRAGASAAANTAINDGAQIILGPLFSSSVRAVKAIAKPRNVNVIAFSTDWTLADNNTFMMGFMPFSQVERVTEYAIENGYKNFALVAPTDKYGNLVTTRFEKAVSQNGGLISKSIRFPPGDPAVINQVAELKGGHFQAVFMPVGGVQTEMISSALSYNRMMPNKIKRIGTGLWDDPRIASQPNIQGGWFAAPSPQSRHNFESKYFNTYGEKPPRLATLAYDATALTAALARNGFEQNGAPAFNNMAITNKNGFAGIDGVFRFGADGIIQRKLAVLELRNGRIIEIDPAAGKF